MHIKHTQYNLKFFNFKYLGHCRRIVLFFCTSASTILKITWINKTHITFGDLFGIKSMFFRGNVMTTIDFFITSSAETEDPQAALISQKKKKNCRKYFWCLRESLAFGLLGWQGQDIYWILAIVFCLSCCLGQDNNLLSCLFFSGFVEKLIFPAVLGVSSGFAWKYHYQDKIFYAYFKLGSGCYS